MRSTRDEWRSGWPIVLAAAWGLGATALYFYTLGMVIPSLTAAFGWSQAQIASGPMIISIVYFCLSSRIGGLVDRLGVRRVLLPGYCAFCIALAMLGLAGPSIWSWYGLWFLLALAFSTTAPSLWSTAVVRHFDRARALALSIALCSTGVMAAITPIIQAWAIETGGWRMAYGVLGTGMLVIGFPVLYFCLPRAHGVAGATSSPAVGAAADLPGALFRDALRSPRFWIIAALALFTGAAIGALMVHLPSIGLAEGLTTAQVAAITGLIGIMSIGGRLSIGLLMDRFPVRIVGAVTFILPVGACLILAWYLTPATMAFAAILIGIINGGDYNVLALLTSRYLGMRNYAAIYSQIAAAFNIGIGTGPAIVGAFHDRIHSYPPLLVGLAGIFVGAAILAMLLGREPDFAPARD